MPLINVKRLDIPDVMLFQFKVFEDDRGVLH